MANLQRSDRFDGQVVVIIGGKASVAAQISLYFHRLGAKVVCNNAGNQVSKTTEHLTTTKEPTSDAYKTVDLAVRAFGTIHALIYLPDIQEQGQTDPIAENGNPRWRFLMDEQQKGIYQA